MLETERIILRKIEPKDASTLLKWGQDNIYHKRAGYQYLQDLDDIYPAMDSNFKYPI